MLFASFRSWRSSPSAVVVEDDVVESWATWALLIQVVEEEEVAVGFEVALAAGGIGCALSGAIAATVAEGDVGSWRLVVADLEGLFVGLSRVGHCLETCCLLPQVQHRPCFCFRSAS